MIRFLAGLLALVLAQAAEAHYLWLERERGTASLLHAPNGWDQEQQTDAAGQPIVSLPWRGQYVFEVVHRDPRAGEFSGRAFEAWRHRAALTIVRRDGIDPQGTGTLAARLRER